MTQPTTLPLTYPDLVDVTDLDPFASETTSDLQTLQQDVLHVLIEQPGSNPDDPTRGIGIDNYLSGTAADLVKARSIIDQQLTQDDRITSSSTSIGPNPDTSVGGYIVEIAIIGSAGVFGLSYGWTQQTGLTPR
jgi:hypothetical protein